MPIKHIRLNNLEILLKEFETYENIATCAGISAAYLSQIKTQRSAANGTPRGMGNKIARKLEKGCGKPNGWMDERHTQKEQQQEGANRTLHQEQAEYGAGMQTITPQQRTLIVKMNSWPPELQEALYSTANNLNTIAKQIKSK